MMKFNGYITLVSFFYLLVACGSASVVNADDEELIETMINQKSFKIISQSASPQNTAAFNAVANSVLLAPGNTPGLINLIGNANYLKVNGDSISAYLPFYGERRMGGAYGTRGIAIEFEGVPTDYVVKNGKKNDREIRFQIRDKVNTTERYQVRINIYPNLTTNININSSHRTFITYRGAASKLEKDN